MLAKYGFGLAQLFNAFYHRAQILNEERDDVRRWRAAAVAYFRQQLTRVLDLMGVAVPASNVGRLTMALIAIAQNRRMSDYVESVRRAGGEPIEVGADGEAPEHILARVDGVLLTGGGDVDPDLYGEARHATFDAAESGRDAFEIALTKAAIKAGIPYLAICRGMQLLNVAMGGTLIQDIPSQVPGALQHEVPEPRFAIAHEIWVSKDSLLSKLLADHMEDGETCHVNSRHHQSVQRVAERLRGHGDLAGRRRRSDGKARQRLLRRGAVAPGELLAHRRVPIAVRRVYRGCEREKAMTVSTCAVFGNRSKARTLAIS